VSSIIRPATEAITSSVVIERTYRAPLEELWALWMCRAEFWLSPVCYRNQKSIGELAANDRSNLGHLFCRAEPIKARH
jgi:hypothetical protein